MMPSKLRIALVQCDIKDNDVKENLCRVERQLADLQGQADLVVFPEAITTGFSRQALGYADEWEGGEAMQELVSLSKKYQLGIVASLFVHSVGGHYNRFVLIDGEAVQWQDKRHLFSLGGEPDMVKSASERRVLSFRSWRIMPLVCYDLRFPVWSRCVANDYDLIICLANWPKARREVWRTLLKARAMENLAYVVGVNRVGQDLAGLSYVGDSLVYSPRGEGLCDLAGGEEQTACVELDYQPFDDLRHKFPVWQDADVFEIK